MSQVHDIQRFQHEMRSWRHYLHQHPELAFEEIQTAHFIAEKLKEFGLQVHQGLGKTGVVASITQGSGNKKIALRADMDALPIQENNQFAHKSRHYQTMHACGHDGHSAMLLGAASYLASNRHFNGTVHFIFQPAEEGRAGAKAMIDDGLFEKFPTDYVFGMHNFPDIPVGHFAVKPGAMMAACDRFEITVSGCATHAAMPHLGDDVMVASAQMIMALQTIVSRNINPGHAAVVSITQIHAGHTWNAIPETAVLCGTYRCFDTEQQHLITHKIKQLVTSIANAFGVKVEICFNPGSPGYPVTFNTDAEAELAAQVAISLVGESCVDRKPIPSMGSEDFAFMLQKKPGCYLWIGNGPSQGSCLLHNPNYDFNDDILPLGAAYWVKLVETILT